MTRIDIHTAEDRRREETEQMSFLIIILKGVLGVIAPLIIMYFSIRGLIRGIRILNIESIFGGVLGVIFSLSVFTLLYPKPALRIIEASGLAHHLTTKKVRLYAAITGIITFLVMGIFPLILV